MQAFHPGTGMMLEFPDNTPAEDIDRHFQNAQANMPINAPSVAQQFLDGARGAYEQQQLAPAPVNGAGFVGLDPQQAQFMLQQRQNQAAMQQQSASEQARNRIEQQKMTQQSLESAADRAQTLKLRKQELQNLVAAKKIEADADKFEADLAAKGKELDRESRLKLEEMRQAAADRRAGDKLYNLNGQLVDGSGNVIADNTRQPTPQGVDWKAETIMMLNPETNQQEAVRVWAAPGQEPIPIGPAPPSGSSGGGANDTITHDSKSVQSDVARQAMDIMETARQQGKTVDPVTAREEAERIVYPIHGLSSFRNGSDKRFIEQKAQELQPAIYEKLAAESPGLNQEKLKSLALKEATNQAEVLRWKADGMHAFIDADGEVSVVTPDGKDPREK